jgi:hypothetical protein
MDKSGHCAQPRHRAASATRGCWRLFYRGGCGQTSHKNLNPPRAQCSAGSVCSYVGSAHSCVAPFFALGIPSRVTRWRAWILHETQIEMCGMQPDPGSSHHASDPSAGLIRPIFNAPSPDGLPLQRKSAETYLISRTAVHIFNALGVILEFAERTDSQLYGCTGHLRRHDD